MGGCEPVRVGISPLAVRPDCAYHVARPLPIRRPTGPPSGGTVSLVGAVAMTCALEGCRASLWDWAGELAVWAGAISRFWRALAGPS